MIAESVQRLDHDHQAVWFQHAGGPLQCLDNVRGLEIHVELSVDVTGDHGYPLRVDALCDVD